MCGSLYLSSLSSTHTHILHFTYLTCARNKLLTAWPKYEFKHRYRILYGSMEVPWSHVFAMFSCHLKRWDMAAHFWNSRRDRTINNNSLLSLATTIPFICAELRMSPMGHILANVFHVWHDLSIHRSIAIFISSIWEDIWATLFKSMYIEICKSNRNGAVKFNLWTKSIKKMFIDSVVPKSSNLNN